MALRRSEASRCATTFGAFTFCALDVHPVLRRIESIARGLVGLWTRLWKSGGTSAGQTTWMRDEARIVGQPDYKEGWHQGYVACYRKWLDHPSMSNTGT